MLIYKKFILLCHKFVLLSKIIEKQRGISSRGSAYKVYQIFLVFLNPEEENGVKSENWTIEE